MLRILSRLAAAVATLFLIAAVQTGSAVADPPDANGCRIAPGFTFAFTPSCHNDTPASSYYVAFHLNAPAGTTFAWSITGDWTSVVTGCGASDAYCTVQTPGSDADRRVVARVTANGTPYVFRAIINWYCGSRLC